MKDSVMTLKLLVDKRDRKVVFAEANKDFVDFLFYILTLPIGAGTRLLAKEPLSGSLGDLYDSIENLNETYMLEKKTKNTVLNPKPTTYGIDQDLFSFPYDPPPTIERKFYRCSGSNHRCKYVTHDPKAVCPNCRCYMLEEVAYVASEAAKVAATMVEGGGYVKGVVTYMVMDNLAVKPMSTISTITLLNRLKIKDVGDLVEKEVHLGMKEGLKLLKASLECKHVLTSVFLDNKDDVEIV